MGIVSRSVSFRGRFGDHFRAGDHFGVGIISPTLNSIRQTDVDTLMIRTQSRVRVRVRVIYLNQTGIRHQILGGVGVRMMHSRSDAPSSNPTHSILNCFFLKNWRHFDFYEHFIKKFHIRKVKCLVRGGCQFGGWNQVTTWAVQCDDVKSEIAEDDWSVYIGDIIWSLTWYTNQSFGSSLF